MSQKSVLVCILAVAFLAVFGYGAYNLGQIRGQVIGGGQGVSKGGLLPRVEPKPPLQSPPAQNPPAGSAVPLPGQGPSTTVSPILGGLLYSLCLAQFADKPNVKDICKQLLDYMNDLLAAGPIGTVGPLPMGICPLGTTCQSGFSDICEGDPPNNDVDCMQTLQTPYCYMNSDGTVTEKCVAMDLPCKDPQTECVVGDGNSLCSTSSTQIVSIHELGSGDTCDAAKSAAEALAKKKCSQSTTTNKCDPCVQASMLTSYQPVDSSKCEITNGKFFVWANGFCTVMQMCKQP